VTGDAAALAALTAADPDLARALERWGPPPRWARPPGFATLVRIILEQQVSLASAAAAFARLEEAGGATPEGFLDLDGDALRRIGFSRQKAGYGRDLAAAMVEGRFDLHAVAALDDGEAEAALRSVRGVGEWTAAIYLMMALRRPDVWPAGDLALASAVAEVKDLPERPGPDAMIEIAEPWRPHRSVAARLLWHHYLSR
jgi:DNA-3-methyladenine glycosylase II